MLNIISYFIKIVCSIAIITSFSSFSQTKTEDKRKDNSLILNIDNATVQRKRIAVVPFVGNSFSDKIDYIVSVDLKQSGVFSPISPTSYAERPTNSKNIPFDKFRNMNVPYLVLGEITDISEAKVVRFALIDNFQEKVVGSYNVPVKNNNVRLAAHYVSDIILQKTTGTRGAFATNIAYIYESGTNKSRRYKLMISDIDGHNIKSLLTSVAPIMSPRFSPNNEEIAYVSFEGDKSQIITQNIKNGFRKLITAEPGINASPSWSPDGKKIAMSLSRDGNAEIYFKNLEKNTLTRVTNNKSIDTEPVWSNDGANIFFTSDRTGTPQLYKINLTTGKVNRITKQNIYSSGADISRDNETMAFVKRIKGRYAVGVSSLKDGGFTKISQGRLDETPRFSPNGQMIIYTSIKNGQEVLKIVNIDGSGENVLSGTGNIRDADWSNYEKIK